MSSNYLSSFGYRYCHAYVEKNDRFSTQSQNVLAELRQCLIDELEMRRDLTCDNVKAIAFETHEHCYREHDFCQLPKIEQIKILNVVKGALLRPDYRRAIRKIYQMCRSEEKSL